MRQEWKQFSFRNGDLFEFKVSELEVFDLYIYLKFFILEMFVILVMVKTIKSFLISAKEQVRTCLSAFSLYNLTLWTESLLHQLNYWTIVLIEDFKNQNSTRLYIISLNDQFWFLSWFRNCNEQFNNFYWKIWWLCFEQIKSPWNYEYFYGKYFVKVFHLYSIPIPANI